MRKSLADRSDGEERIDTKLGGVHLTDKTYGPPKYAYSVRYGLQPVDEDVKL